MKRIGSVMVALALLLCLAACGSDVVGEQSGGGEALTTGQSNALKAAKRYLDALPFSYEGLVKQLEFEKYTHETRFLPSITAAPIGTSKPLKRRKAICNPAPFPGIG